MLQKHLENYMFFGELLKKAAVISVFPLSSFIEAQNKIHTCCRLPVVAWEIFQPQFLAISI